MRVPKGAPKNDRPRTPRGGGDEKLRGAHSDAKKNDSTDNGNSDTAITVHNFRRIFHTSTKGRLSAAFRNQAELKIPCRGETQEQKSTCTNNCTGGRSSIGARNTRTSCLLLTLSCLPLSALKVIRSGWYTRYRSMAFAALTQRCVTC